MRKKGPDLFRNAGPGGPAAALFPKRGEQQDETIAPDGEDQPGFPDDDGVLPQEAEHEPAEKERRWRQVTPAVRSALLRLHRNLGHPRHEQLARTLRLGGASPYAIAASRWLPRPECARYPKKTPAMPAQVSRAFSFGGYVQLDEMTYEGVDGVQVQGVVMHDAASDYGVYVPLRGLVPPAQPRAPQLRNAVLDGWVAWANAPDTIVWDQHGSHSGVLAEALDKLNVVQEPMPRDAHHKLGKCERRVQTLQFLATEIQEELEITDEDGAHQALIQANAALNRRIGASGYSPEQWVLGRQSRLPASALHAPELGRLGTMQAAVNDDGFRMSLAIREAAEKAMVKLDHSQTIRSAVLAGSRATRPRRVCAGDVVHFWRSTGNRKRGEFVGPARVIGKDQHGWWLVHRGTPVLADERQLRHSTVTEKEAWALVRQALWNPVQRAAEGQRGYVDIRQDGAPDDVEMEEVAEQSEPQEVPAQGGDILGPEFDASSYIEEVPRAEPVVQEEEAPVSAGEVAAARAAAVGQPEDDDMFGEDEQQQQEQEQQPPQVEEPAAEEPAVAEEPG